ncbi:MAG: hypothetical protein ACXV7J_14120 [Methylomonas sp.]
MKNLKKQSLLAFGGLAMVINAGAASSSTTHASAIIDWSTFNITGYPLGPGAAPTYVLSGQSSNATSSISDWVNWTSNVTNTGSLFAVSTEGTGVGNGSAAADRTANLTITGNGFLTISAHYILNAAINGVGCTDYFCSDQNSASASASFSLTNYSSKGAHSALSEASIGLGNSWDWPYSGLISDQHQGTLFVSVLVNNGDTLNFSSFVSADARQVVVGPVSSVPVPSAMWLFGSALLGMVGLRLQKRGVVV